jgi:hypothetical protein
MQPRDNLTDQRRREERPECGEWRVPVARRATVSVAPADAEPGERAGYQNGRESCTLRTQSRQPSSTDRGYAIGSADGYNKSRREVCGDEG